MPAVSELIEMFGFVLSTLIPDTVYVAELPALSADLLVTDWLAHSEIGVSGVTVSIPDKLSEAVK